MKHSRAASLAVPFAFGCVYFFWGSTYTAIKIGVQFLHPLVLGSTRFLIAGALLLAFCRLRGMQILPAGRDLAWLVVVGLMLLGGGNIALIYGERYIDSGLAALLMAALPLYIAIFGLILPHGERLVGRGWAGLGLGFAGLIALLWPGMHHEASGWALQLQGCVIVMGGTFSWAAGSVLSRELKLPVNPIVAAGWEMLAAGIASGAVGLLTGAWSASAWSPRAIGAVSYLVVFGSLVGYTAFVWLLENVPVSKVSTYAYVNPVVAVILGAIFLGERLAGVGYIGMAAVIVAVALVTSSRIRAEQAQQTRKIRAVPVKV